MSYNPETQHRINALHLASPQVGDYWEDHFAPVLVVLEVHDDHIIACVDIIQETHYWMWDFRKPTKFTFPELYKKLKYGGTGPVADKTWAAVHPKSHLRLVRQNYSAEVGSWSEDSGVESF